MRKVFLIVLCFLITTVTYAEEFKYILSPYLGYHFFNAERSMKDNLEVGGKVERFFNEKLGFEVGLGYVPTETGSNENNLIQYHTHLKYYFANINKLKPYISGGIGGDLTRGMNIGPSVALGAKYHIKDNIGVFGEVRDNFLFGDGNDFILLFLQV